MKKLLGILLCSSAVMFGAETNVVKKSAFKVVLPTGENGWACQKSTFGAAETGRQAGWIAVIAQGAPGTMFTANLAPNVCTQFVNGLPDEVILNMRNGSPANSLIPQFISKLKRTYSKQLIGPSYGGATSIGGILKLAVWMKYGNTLISAFGKQDDDQTCWLPDVKQTRRDLPQSGEIKMTFEGDPTAPVVTWTRACAAATSSQEPWNGCRTY